MHLLMLGQVDCCPLQCGTDTNQHKPVWPVKQPDKTVLMMAHETQQKHCDETCWCDMPIPV